jgi:hypothetical protein
MKQREKTIPRTDQVRLPEALDRLIKLSTATNKPDDAKKWQAERAIYPEVTPIFTKEEMTKAGWTVQKQQQESGRRDLNLRPHGPDPSDRSGTAARSSGNARLLGAATPRRQEVGAYQA